MVISSLNIKLINDRLGFVIKACEKLKQLALLNKDDFTAVDSDNPAIAESYLRRALEAIFDIGRHILARTAGKGVVEYIEIAKMLGDRGVISKGCSSKLILMAGYRNRLVHFYHEVGDDELYLILKEHLVDIEVFIKEIKKFIEKYRKNRH